MPCMPGAGWMWPAAKPSGRHGAPQSCRAGKFGLYYLIRDIVVAFAALGGAFLWQVSPRTNLLTAFAFGVIGTVGFAIFGRDMPVPAGRPQGGPVDNT